MGLRGRGVLWLQVPLQAGSLAAGWVAYSGERGSLPNGPGGMHRPVSLRLISLGSKHLPQGALDFPLENCFQKDT